MIDPDQFPQRFSQDNDPAMSQAWKGLRTASLVCGALGIWPPAAAQDIRALTDESRRIADQLVQQVRGELVKSMETSGPLRSIVVCKYAVPEISSALSRKSGAKVTRVSLSPRNPALGGPDAWERKVLTEFDARVRGGENGEGLEHAEIVSEGPQRYFRYMKALPMGPLCVSCHGTAEQIAPAVKTQLSAEYPHDKAVGYRLGQVRGAVTVKRPLD